MKRNRQSNEKKKTDWPVYMKEKYKNFSKKEAYNYIQFYNGV
jgi:hypothetical protein